MKDIVAKLNKVEKDIKAGDVEAAKASACDLFKCVVDAHAVSAKPLLKATKDDDKENEKVEAALKGCEDACGTHGVKSGGFAAAKTDVATAGGGNVVDVKTVIKETSENADLIASLKTNAGETAVIPNESKLEKTDKDTVATPDSWKGGNDKEVTEEGGVKFSGGETATLKAEAPKVEGEDNKDGKTAIDASQIFAIAQAVMMLVDMFKKWRNK